MRVTANCRRGFTLVELLVVIGIIAVLIGILLPVLSGVQARGRDIKCQSNLRQIMQAVIGYATENKGSMPYGFYWNRSNNQHPNPYDPSNNWDAAPDNPGSSGDPENDFPFISWASLVGKYMVRRANGDNDDANFPPVLLCPEAQQVQPHVVSYVMNMVVAVAPYYEVVTGVAPRYQIKPATQSMLLKDGTAMVWDTAIRPNWENNVGHLVGADIDGERFWVGARTPQYRYWTDKDIFGRLPPGQFGQNRPINLGMQSNPYVNKDPNTSAIEPWPYQGNLRFRHNKETACNVGFSDGSVRQFLSKPGPDRTVRSHDALRKFFMVKWPAGTPVDGTQPF